MFDVFGGELQAKWLDVLTSFVKDCLLPLFVLHCKRGQAGPTAGWISPGSRGLMTPADLS